MKVIRCFSLDVKTNSKIQRRLQQELDIWKRLRHHHVIPLFGIIHGLGRYASMVSPWMHKGNASNYFVEQDVQRSLTARLKLLYEVASGLEYLHCFSPPVIHGDLKASNILVSDNGEALLSDFGISAVFEEATGSACLVSSSFAGSVRWMAFELFRIDIQGEDGDEPQEIPQLTTYSDIWSYGSTALEVLSGKLPYHHRKNDVQVLHEIMRGLKPSREISISTDIWAFLQTCWRDEPKSRPPISRVKETMGRIYRENRRMGVIFEEGHLYQEK
ncbi:kinase-like protein [Phellopilus nigrolimitatus]|nr:kinase-like protein [Phellopilus nigrolimitatus]